MMIGQISHTFSDDEVRVHLGGPTTLPPNVERTSTQDLWRIFSLGYWRMERRQASVDRYAWEARKELKLPTAGVANFIRQVDIHLFIRRDLSGVILALDHNHARPNSKDAIWGYYQRHTFKFAACRHQTLTSGAKNAYSTYTRSTCAQCGFWTEVDSSD